MKKTQNQIRDAIVAGMFYAGSQEALEREIKACFLSPYGPGTLPLKNQQKQKEALIAAIMPHAGYSYSGPCAAYGYERLAAIGKPETIILLAPNHTGLGNNGISLQDWKTPLGVIENNQILGKTIAKATGIPIDELPHEQEHSIEVQLPFLQFLWKPTPTIVPVVLGYPDWKTIGKGLGEVLKEWKENVLLIASSDFIHYGIHYHYVPSFINIKEQITAMDEEAWSFIQQKNPKEFLQWCDKTGATICGKYPIAVLLETIKQFPLTAQKLCHYNSGDLSRDYHHCVDYMSIVFTSRKEDPKEQ